jgi:L-rhamnose mutarotase
MRATIVGAGILHFEIHLIHEYGLLFAFVVRRGDHSMDSFRGNPVWRRWQAHMSDILLQDGDSPLRIPLERVFSLRAGTA